MPGLSFDDGHAVDIRTGTPVAATARQRSEYEASQRLGDISSAWVKSLPKRPDARGTRGALIPH
jgi:hypothetical protein